MGFAVYGHNVAVIPLFDPDKSKGGIYIPEMAKERCDQGIVKYIGDEVKWIKPGDYVLFSGYTGKAIRFEDEGTLLIMNDEFIVAKMEGSTIETTEVPGLFFQGKKKTFFTATVEFALILIAKALEEAEWRRGIKSKDMLARRPKEAAFRR